MNTLQYTIRQQDGTLQPMACPDTTSNRLFVQYVAKAEGHYKPVEQLK